MTFAGPLVVMETWKEVGFGPPQVHGTTAGVEMDTPVTRPVGMARTGTLDRSPEVIVTELATQHCVPSDHGLVICHQLLVGNVPRIGTVFPTIRAPPTGNPCPGRSDSWR